MQPMKRLNNWIQENATDSRYLFLFHDLRQFLPDMSDSAFKVLLSRMAESSCLTRVCRGLYACKKFIGSNVLFHAALTLRAHEFNYISLETVLSEAGVISQIPMNWVSLMSSGRSSVISCGNLGTIEFVHTTQKPAAVMDNLTYDSSAGIWRANIPLALRDAKATHRAHHLINWEAAHEFVR